MNPRCLGSSVGLSWSLQLKDFGKVTQASKTTLSLAYRLGAGPCRERSCTLVQRTGPGAWSVSWAPDLRALNRRLSSQVNFKLFWFCFLKTWSLLRSHENQWHLKKKNNKLKPLFPAVRECRFHSFMRISTIPVSGNGFTPGMWLWFLSHEQK